MTPETAAAWVAAGLIAGAAAAVEAMRQNKGEAKKERVPVPVEKERDHHRK
jgi:hypothetical protein